MRVLAFGTYERDYPRNAQVTACLRRAGVEVDLARRKVQRDGLAVHLTPKEFELLALLAARRTQEESSCATC